MHAQFFTNYIETFLLGVLLFLVLLGLIALSKKKRQREKYDPPFIFGSIRGMYVCYQCDTIFNSPRCPGCDEEAVVPLVQLTGSIIEDERVAAVVSKLQGRNTWKLLIAQTDLGRQANVRAPASRLESSDVEPLVGSDFATDQTANIPVNGSGQSSHN